MIRLFALLVVVETIVSSCADKTVNLLEPPENGATDTGAPTNADQDTSPDGTAASCTSDALHAAVIPVDVGIQLVANENEADLAPVVLSPIPSGGARIAVMGVDGAVHIASTDTDLAPQGTPVTIQAHDLQDLLADDTGGVVLITRPAQGGGTGNCGAESDLCLAPDPSIPCYDMYLVRFDGEHELWATQLTESSADLPPYSTGPDGPDVTFIWWYAHHGRIAQGSRGYAAYFGSAISVSTGTCINIHQGDRMQLVDTDGALLDGGFGWGCSPSGYERVVWNPAAHAFSALCKSEVHDAEGGRGAVAFAPDQTPLVSVDPWYANLSEVVLAPDGGYWFAVSDRRPDQPERADGAAIIRLVHTTAAGVDIEHVVEGDADTNLRAPHVAPLGNGRLVLLWESSNHPGDLGPQDDRTVHLQVRSATDGTPLGEVVTVPGAVGHRYHAMRTTPSGTVLMPLGGASGSIVPILKVTACP